MTALAKKIVIAIVVVVLLFVIGIGILVGASIAGWKAAIRAGNEASAIQSVKTIAVVEARYFNTHNRTFAAFDQLVKDGFDSRFAGDLPLVDGYTFSLKLMPKTSSAPASYTLNADPLNSSTGKNHFYLDSTDGSIRVNADRPAGAQDSPLGQ